MDEMLLLMSDNLGPADLMRVKDWSFDASSLVIPFFRPILLDLGDTGKADSNPASHWGFHRYLTVNLG
jgi:hypothetical protein